MTQPPDPYEEMPLPDDEPYVPSKASRTAAPALYSLEAEEAVCGAVLIDPDVYWELSQFLKPVDFHTHKLRWVWESFGRLFDTKSAVDLITVSDDLDKHGKLKEAGGSAWITSLITSCVGGSTLNAVHYGRIIEAYAVRRKLVEKGSAVVKLAWDEKRPLDDVLKDYADLVEQQVDYSAKDDTIDSDDASLSLMERILSGTPTGVKTGFPIFDGVDGLGGLPIGATLLMGDSSFGKSVIALQVCEQIALAGQTALYMGFETTNDAMVLRRVSNAAGVNPRSVRTATMTDVEKNNLISVITNNYQGKYGSKLKFNNKATSLRDIEKAIRIHRPVICVVDQISQVSDEISPNPTMNLLKIYTRLKALGNKYNVAMLVVHLVSAEESKAFFERNKKANLSANQGQAGAKKHKNIMPDINAIPWASQIKGLTDALLFLVPEVNQQLVGASVYEILIWIMKDRDGQRFEPTFWDFDLKAQWFTDKPNSYKQKMSAQRPSTFTPPVP